MTRGAVIVRERLRFWFLAWVFSALLILTFGVVSYAAETRSYVVSWYGHATNSQEGACSRGVHPDIVEIYVQYLEHHGLSPSRIEELYEEYINGNRGPVSNMMAMRGRIDGKPVDGLLFPASVVDLNLPGVDGKYAYGFDLDQLGPNDPDGFEDPITHEVGIDHQLYRALGCARLFRGTLEEPPVYWAWSWDQLDGSQPAWLITITGEDLDNDGPVIITINRALEHLRINNDSSPRSHMSYRTDPDPRSQNTFEGEIENGVIRVTDHRELFLLQNPLVAPVMKLANFHLRLKERLDGNLEGFMAGYQPWHDIYWAFGSLGVEGEQMVSNDATQFYHLLKRYADAHPDPVSGQNKSISATYYLEAVPAYIYPAIENQQP